MAVKTLADSLKKSATTNVISSSSSTPAVISASNTKMVEAIKPVVVLNDQELRGVVEKENKSTSSVSQQTDAAIRAAKTLSQKSLTKDTIVPAAKDSSPLIVERMQNNPSSVIVPNSTAEKAKNILDDAVREMEEEFYKKQVEEASEAEKQRLAYELMASGSNGEQREDGTVDPEEVDLEAMQEAAARSVAEQALNTQEAPASRETLAENQPIEEPKWYEKLLENKTAVICGAVAFLVIIVLFIKNRNKE